MYLEELREYFGTYADMTRQLGLGNTTYLFWKKKGYIPFTTQCVIEKKTKRRFRADKNHEKPIS